MKIGFLFPGQGAQSINMGKDLYDEYEEYRNVYKKVEELTNVNVLDITFNSDESILNQTKNTQICILTMSLAILKLLEKENVKGLVSSGLSLGEYTALIYSKLISFEDGVKIVQKRGELMQNLCPKGDWRMCAILGLDEEKVENICQNVKNGFVSTANYNCPGQIVISGEKEAVYTAMEKAKECGAKRVIELNTSGPFHTEKLKDASIALRKELDNIKINNFETKVIRNLDGKQYNENDNIREILSKHIVNPVRFEDCIKTMLDLGVDCFIEVGPGKTLSGFVRKINKEVNVFNINSVETLKSTLEFLKGGIYE